MWRIKQADNNPGRWVLGDRSDIKMGVVLLNHLSLVSLPKFGFPLVPILSFPFAEGLAHLPIRAEHLMPVACIVVARELVTKIEGYFLKFRWRLRLKQIFLPQYRQLRWRPVRGFGRLDGQLLDGLGAE